MVIIFSNVKTGTLPTCACEGRQRLVDLYEVKVRLVHIEEFQFNQGYSSETLS